MATRRTLTRWEPSTFYGPGWSVAKPNRLSEKPPASAGGGVTDEVLEAVEHTLGVSCQYTEPSYSLNVHNDGDFYRPHQDTSAEYAPRRLLTFVYYLHRTPRPFDGGELRVFDAALPLHTDTAGKWQERTWRDWEPEHDSIVFFRPTAWHEIRPVSCPGRQHADSRFAVNGWLCSPDPANHGRASSS